MSLNVFMSNPFPIITTVSNFFVTWAQVFEIKHSILKTSNLELVLFIAKYWEEIVLRSCRIELILISRS